MTEQAKVSLLLPTDGRGKFLKAESTHHKSRYRIGRDEVLTIISMGCLLLSLIVVNGVRP